MLHVLRKHRRLVSAALVATLLVWLISLLASCLLAPMSSTANARAGDTTVAQAETMMSEMPQCPGGVCATMENGRQPVADQLPVPATPKLLLIALFVTLSLVLAANPKRSGALPPEPSRPKRSPALRFYALRI